MLMKWNQNWKAKEVIKTDTIKTGKEFLYIYC